MKILKSIDLQELQEIRSIQKRMTDLHVLTSPVTTVRIESSLNGKVTELYEDRSKSWVRNTYSTILSQVMMCPMYDSGTYNTCKYADDGLYYRLTTGTNWGGSDWAGFNMMHYEQYFRARASQVDRGIVVGVGTAEEKLSSHALSSICSNGYGLNQLNYQAQLWPVIRLDATTRVLTVTHSRSILNSSGNTVMISEVALYTRAYTPSHSEQSIMLNRDLLDQAIAVLNNGLLTVTYTMELQLPPA